MPTGNLPPKAKRQWEHVYESSLARGLPPSHAAASAWSAVKRGYKKCGSKWIRKSTKCRYVAGRMLK